MKLSTTDILKMISSKILFAAVLTLTLCSIAYTQVKNPGSERIFHFSLSIEEKRAEKRIAGLNLDAVRMDFDSKIRLFGRIISYKTDSSIVFYTINDSIIYSSSSPMPVSTFMSADTMYYSTDAARNVISKGYIPKYDSMLACVFKGKALRISIDFLFPNRAGNPKAPIGFSEAQVLDIKKECNSGEYSHINLPISLGAFFVSFPFSGKAKNYIWNELQPLPSFSGLHFHPQLRIALKTVDVKPRKVTAVFSADTIFKDVTIITPSTKRIVILQNRIHIGGTIIIDRSLAMPQKGEIRIEESIQLLRPELSSHVGSKKCSYIMRLEVN